MAKISIQCKKKAKIFFFSKPSTEIKSQQGMYPNGLKLSMIGRSFSIPRREAERGFLLLILSKIF